jgi:fucose 4-O-acetylase-like acetyltransferase
MVWEYRIRHKIRFLYFIKPNQIHQWDVKEPWTGYHILISPLLLQNYNIDFSFLQYEINEALEDEQIKLKIYTFKSLMNTKRQLRIRYLNCLLQFDFLLT